MLECQGVISTATDGSPVCSGEWVSNDLTVFLQSLFSTPPDLTLQQAFMAGFSLPMIVYLTAWAFQVVINFASKERHF